MLKIILINFAIIETKLEIFVKTLVEVANKTVQFLNDENFVKKMYTK